METRINSRTVSHIVIKDTEKTDFIWCYKTQGVKDIDGVLWYLPSVSIYLGGEVIKNLFFETYEEAKQYCDVNFPEVNVTC